MLLCLLAALGVAPAVIAGPSAGAAPVASYRVIRAYPHDPDAFTQGLVYDGGVLYEGTGLQGRSSLRRVDLETGRVLQNVSLDSAYFGEGIALFGERIYQLTWKSHICFVYDKTTFTLLGTFSYTGEGWGLTSDGQHLIMSDGTSTLAFRDPDTFAIVRQIEATDHGTPITRLDELEYIEGEIWANVWQTDRIARIDPRTGKVLGWLDLTGLLSPADQAGRTVDVLNGIAYDATEGRIFVTGKLWPVLYHVVPVPAMPAPATPARSG
ncbi:MAG: glutamine cyclotransferase [Chloroflexota bacterium]